MHGRDEKMKLPCRHTGDIKPLKRLLRILASVVTSVRMVINGAKSDFDQSRGFQSAGP